MCGQPILDPNNDVHLTKATLAHRPAAGRDWNAGSHTQEDALEEQGRYFEKGRGDVAQEEGSADEMQGKQMETKERNGTRRMQSGRSAEHTASPSISGREE